MSYSRSSLQDPQARARDSQTRFIKESVNKVERSFSAICGQMGSINRRQGRLRDKFDEMAKYLVDHAITEQGPMKTTFTNFAENISAIQDYRQAMSDLNKMMKSRGREMKTHRQLDQVRNKAPSDTQQITRAETELQRATLEVERSSQSLEQTIDRFENKRVTDIKQILSDYVQIEMLFHAKALERLTLCHQSLQNFDLEDHLAIFRNSLRPSHLEERLNLVQQQSGPNSQNTPATDIYATPQKRKPATENGQGEDTYEENSEDDEYLDDEEEEEEEEQEESEYESEEESEAPAPRQSRTRPF